MARASSWAGCRVVASGRRAMRIPPGNGYSSDDRFDWKEAGGGLTGIGSRKHARLWTGRSGAARRAQRADPGPDSCRPVRHRLALGRAPGGGEQVPLQLLDYHLIQRPGLVLDTGPDQHRAEGGVELVRASSIDGCRPKAAKPAERDGGSGQGPAPYPRVPARSARTSRAPVPLRSLRCVTAAGSSEISWRPRPFQEDHGGVVTWFGALVGQDGMGEPTHRLGCRLTGQGLTGQQVGQTGLPDRLSGQIAALDDSI